MNLNELTAFIVEAKRLTYVGNGRKSVPSRKGAKDLVHGRGEWSYHDSYFGGADFIGQETIWFQGLPVWP